MTRAYLLACCLGVLTSCASAADPYSLTAERESGPATGDDAAAADDGDLDAVPPTDDASAMDDATGDPTMGDDATEPAPDAVRPRPDAKRDGKTDAKRDAKSDARPWRDSGRRDSGGGGGGGGGMSDAGGLCSAVRCSRYTLCCESTGKCYSKRCRSCCPPAS